MFVIFRSLNPESSKYALYTQISYLVVLFVLNFVFNSKIKKKIKMELWYDSHHTGALRVIDYHQQTITGSDCDLCVLLPLFSNGTLIMHLDYMGSNPKI